MKEVLIAGCGDVGTVLGLELAGEGIEVFGLRRDPSRLPPPITPVAADLGDPASLIGLPAVDAIVYATAADEFTEAAYRRAYVDGVRNLLEALGSRAESGRFVHLSSTSVYAQTGGEWVDEESVTEPRHWSGRTLLEGEQIVLRRSGEPVLLRLAGIYGPGRTRLIDEVVAGRATYVAGQPQFTNRIHRDDAAGAVRHLLHLEAPKSLYLGVDEEPVDRREVFEWLARELGGPPPRATRESAARRGGANRRCRNDRLLASGFRFRYPSFRDGYAALIASRPAGDC